MLFKKCLLALLALALLMGAVPAFAEYNKPYYIEVDLTNQIVTVYNTSDNSIARQMLCSSGAPGHDTIEGEFYLPAIERDDERNGWYNFYTQHVYGKWATRIYGPYLFHSIPCYQKDEDTVVPRYLKQFGMPDSHGCVRLRVDDAYFIAKNCLRGTYVKIYKSGELNEDLRQLLFVSSYTGEDGMTYQEFLGISEDCLGSGSSGTEVMDLQYRLADLGYFGDEPDGKYDNETIIAVKNVQKDLGLADNGIANPALLEIIFSDDAPVSAGQATLKEGKSGPVVRRIQIALQTLGLYDGEMDSVLDVDVTDAVKKFQSACNYPVDGVLTPEMQHAIYYTVDQLEEKFGEGNIPPVELVTEEINIGTIEAPANIRVRSEPSTESKELGKVLIGDKVRVVKVEGDWAQIAVGNKTGYIYKKYLGSPEVDYNYMLRYTDASGESYTIGHTMDEYMNGTRSFADEFSDIYASESYRAENSNTVVDYVTVNTGSADVLLNLRAEPNSEADVLAQVPNGTNLRVLSSENGWTRVGYKDSIGYLMSDYLTFWEGSIEEVEESYATLDSIDDVNATLSGMENPKALVIDPEKDQQGNNVKPYLFEEASRKGDKLTTMAVGAEVEIVQFIDGGEGGDDWVQVKYLGQTGYMLAVCLQFEFVGA